MASNQASNQTRRERIIKKLRKRKIKQFFRSKRFVNIVKVIVLVLILAVSVAAVAWMIPWVPILRQPGGIDVLRHKIDSFSPYSWFVLLGIQVLQVVIAFIPGEPIELLSGVMFGTWGGLLLCEIGLLLGTVSVYYLVRWLGKSLITNFFAKDKMKKLQKVLSSKNLPFFVFLLFFIPGTPKDLLTYVVPLTPMKPLQFFLISMVARIPSVVTSTYAGISLGTGNWQNALIMFAVTGALGIGGILIHNKLMGQQEAKKQASVADEIEQAKMEPQTEQAAAPAQADVPIVLSGATESEQSDEASPCMQNLQATQEKAAEVATDNQTQQP